jgi:hypothetical protein
MPTIWENSYVDRLQTLSGRKTKVQKAVEDIRQAVEPLILPDAAKILTAIATDVMTAVEKRNRRADVQKACAALKRAIIILEAIDGNLHG